MVNDHQQKVINKIFESRSESGFWKMLPKSHKYYPEYLHYVPNFRATLWTLLTLADLELSREDKRIRKPLREIQSHFFDSNFGIYTLKEDHFPIPCLNGNMIYLDSYFNGRPGKKSLKALSFFNNFQRFDDGSYESERNKFCVNTSCYGKHSCYWGVIKLFKGISFIPVKYRSKEISALMERSKEISY